MGTIALWLAGFGIPSDVLQDSRLKAEIQACDGHAAWQTLRQVLAHKSNVEAYAKGDDEIRAGGALTHLEFAVLVQRFGANP